jgi:hypothetical protein
LPIDEAFAFLALKSYHLFFFQEKEKENSNELAKLSIEITYIKQASLGPLWLDDAYDSIE